MIVLFTITEVYISLAITSMHPLPLQDEEEEGKKLERKTQLCHDAKSLTKPGNTTDYNKTAKFIEHRDGTI